MKRVTVKKGYAIKYRRNLFLDVESGTTTLIPVNKSGKRCK